MLMASAGCVRGRAVLGIVGGGVTFRFSNGDAIPVENMPFFVRLYALVVLLKTLLDFPTIMVKIISAF